MLYQFDMQTNTSNLLWCLLQLDMTSSACIEIANQLARWGLEEDLADFAMGYQLAYWDLTGTVVHAGLASCITGWHDMQANLAQVCTT